MSGGETRGALLKRLKLRYPIIQGPFGGGLSTVELLAAVSNSGGMGSYGAHLLDPARISLLVEQARAATAGQAFAVNLWVHDNDLSPQGQSEEGIREQLEQFAPFYEALDVEAPKLPLPQPPSRFESQVEALLRAKPPVFSFVFGIPSEEILQECRQRGIFTIGAATTLDEALALEEARVDAVLVTGFEAGGHRPSFLRKAEDSLHGTLALLRQVAQRVRIPLIAAGGIADGKGIAAALVAGAEAVQLGTAFLACEESGTSDMHREVLFSQAAQYTRLTRRFTGRLARFIVTPLLEQLEAAEVQPLPYPMQGEFSAPIKQGAARKGRRDMGILYAGQGAPLLRHRNVPDLMASLIRDAGL